MESRVAAALLPDDIQQSLAIIVAYGVEGAVKGCGNRLRRVLDSLSVSSGRLANQVVLQELRQRLHRDVIVLHCETVGIGSLGGTLHGVPDAVVPPDKVVL